MPQTTDRLQHALQPLSDEVRERIDRHPLGHLVAGRGEPLELQLSVPTSLRDGKLEPAAPTDPRQVFIGYSHMR